LTGPPVRANGQPVKLWAISRFVPTEIDATALMTTALQEGVAFIPGAAFSLSGGFGNALRLAFSAEPPERAREGIRRLRRAIDRQLAGEVAA
jgi:2-aminoadipate transaminase